MLTHWELAHIMLPQSPSWAQAAPLAAPPGRGAWQKPTWALPGSFVHTCPASQSAGPAQGALHWAWPVAAHTAQTASG